MKTPTRKRYDTVAPNIYRYPDGHYEARLRVTGCAPWRQHFHAETALADIKGIVAAQLTTLKTVAQRGKAERRTAVATERRAFGELVRPAGRTATNAHGTLEQDVPRFLEQIATRGCFASDRSHLRAWLDVVVDGRRLGDTPRMAITARHINLAIVQWQRMPSPHAIRKVRVRGYERPPATVTAHTIAGTIVKAHARAGEIPATITSYTRASSTISAHTRAAAAVRYYERSAPATSSKVVSARTIRHRCRLLEDLYRTLDGAKASTPVDEAKVPAKPKQGIPITVPIETVETTLRNLAQADQKTYARFAVAATCAQRPCQVGRTEPDDVTIDVRRGAGVWIVRDAKGAQAHSVTLEGAMVTAWDLFIKTDAWGTFDTTKYGRLIHAAGWPKGIRPYNARHTFSKEAISQGINLGDLQGQLGHSDPKTTRIYAPFVLDQQRKVSKKMKHYLRDALKPAGPRLVKKNK